MYVLEVMSGPLDGTRWRFEREITVGRDETAVGACIAIDRYLSRSHAEITAAHDGLRVRDLSSRNGTTIDGAPIESASLEPGRTFTCGRTDLRVLIAERASDAVDPAASLSRIVSIGDMRSRLLAKPIGFIPTMGGLHEGHLRLVDRALDECASVVVSIFVNPLQFAQGEDFGRYPRDLERDFRLLAERGVRMVFTPDAAEMYPPEFTASIEIGALGETYEGAMRPGHFAGVATIVTKLLHVVQPTRMYLGQKDAQQVAVLRRVARDLDFSTDIVVVPTAREADGLARSTRNAYLSSDERRFAPILAATLTEIADAYRVGGEAAALCAAGRERILRESGRAGVDAAVDYLDVVDAERFTPVEAEAAREDALVVGALRFRGVRLLDNAPVGSG